MGNILSNHKIKEIDSPKVDGSFSKNRMKKIHFNNENCTNHNNNDKIKNTKEIQNKKDKKDKKNKKEFIFDYSLKSIPVSSLKKNDFKNKEKMELWCKKCFGKYDKETEKEMIHFIGNGWTYEYSWYEKNDSIEENFSNIYTIGLKQNYNHLDFQIVLPVDIQVASTLINLFCDQIKNGFQFENGKYYSHIIQGYSIQVIEKIIKLKNKNLKVLRIIFPFMPGLLYISNPENYFKKQINFDSS